jgi:hypothetical protein
MAEKLRWWSLLPLVRAGAQEHASRVLLITCPVTRTDELVADRRIRSVVNHPTHIALHVECPCGDVHVYRTGRRWEAARRAVAARPAPELTPA